MKYLVLSIIFFLTFQIGINAQSQVTVIAYNPFNTQEDIGYIEEYEDDIAKSIEILNEINMSTGELNTEGNILFLTVVYQESLSRDIDQEFEQSMAFISQKVQDCSHGGDCEFLKSKLQKNIKKLERKLKSLKNPHGKRQDMTFFKEYHRSGKKVLSRIYDKVSMVNVSNDKEFKRAVKNMPPNTSLMIMDHAGNRVFGMRIKEFIKTLTINPPSELLLGICRSYLVVDDLKAHLPGTALVYTDDDKWRGFDSRLKDFNAIFPKGYIRR